MTETIIRKTQSALGKKYARSEEPQAEILATRLELLTIHGF